MVAVLTAALMLAAGPASAQAPDMAGGAGASAAIVRASAAGTVQQVVARLKTMIGRNGMMVMGNLNQGRVLSMTGLHVESETLFVGNPQVGKTLFSANPGVGLVVPVRVNVYRDARGHTVVSYVPPSVLLEGYGSPRIDKVAQMLDMKLHKMVGMLGS